MLPPIRSAGRLETSIGLRPTWKDGTNSQGFAPRQPALTSHLSSEAISPQQTRQFAAGLYTGQYVDSSAVYGCSLRATSGPSFSGDAPQRFLSGCAAARHTADGASIRLCVSACATPQLVKDGWRTIYAKDGCRSTALRDTGFHQPHPNAIDYVVPGYLGFVPGIKSQNCHGASFPSMSDQASNIVQDRVVSGRNGLQSSASTGSLVQASDPRISRPDQIRIRRRMQAKGIWV
eukprot:2469561-Prymnesium_polylepis.1